MSLDRMNNPHGPIWYLPNFVIVNKNKNCKTQMVFDAAAKTKGKSLNDELLKGPSLQLKSIINIIMHFRQSIVALSMELLSGADYRKRPSCP